MKILLVAIMSVYLPLATAGAYKINELTGAAVAADVGYISSLDSATLAALQARRTNLYSISSSGSLSVDSISNSEPVVEAVADPVVEVVSEPVREVVSEPIASIEESLVLDSRVQEPIAETTTSEPVLREATLTEEPILLSR